MIYLDYQDRELWVNYRINVEPQTRTTPGGTFIEITEVEKLEDDGSRIPYLEVIERHEKLYKPKISLLDTLEGVLNLMY